MDFLLSSLQFLVKQKKLQPAEVILSEKLSTFEQTVPQNLSEQEIQKVEEVLISLMTINGGTLSMPFASRLSECFAYLYKLPKAPKIFNLVSFVQQKPCQVSYFTLGFVLHSVGKASKSLIPSLIDSILKNYKKLEIPSLFALNGCYKVFDKDSGELSKYVKKIHSICLTYLNPEKPETLQLFALKLVKRICIFTNELPFEKQLTVYRKYLFSEQTLSALTQKKTCELIGKLILHEMNSDKLKFRDVLEEMKKTKNLKNLVSYVIRNVDPQILQQNANTLLSYVRTYNQSEIPTFAHLLSKETKKSLFNSIEKEGTNAKQLGVLNNFIYDDDSERLVSALAIQIVTSKSSERAEALRYFKDLPQRNRRLAAEVIHSCALFLAYPPDNHPKLGRHLIGMGLIVSFLLFSDHSLLAPERELLQKFEMETFALNNILKGSFAAAFLVAKAVVLIDDSLIKISLEIVCNYFKSKKTGEITKKEMNLLSAISSFLVTHPYVKYVPMFIEALKVCPHHIALARMILACSRIPSTTAIFTFLNRFALTTRIPRDFRNIRISPVFIPESALIEMPFYEMKHPKVALEISEEEVGVIVTKCYADFVLQSPEECHNLDFLLKPTPNLNLLLSIASNPKSAPLLPQRDFLNPLFDIFTKSADEIEIQTVAQILSAYALKPENFQQISKRMAKVDPRRRAILTAHMLVHSNPSNQFVLDSLTELSDIAKGDYSKYAFFALSRLFQYCTNAALTLHLAPVECRFLGTVLHSNQMLNPMNFCQAVYCLNNMIPLLSAEGDAELNDVVADIFQCISGLRIPYGLVSYQRSCEQIVAFTRNAVSKNRLKFSQARSDSLVFSLGCASFAGFIKAHRHTDEPQDDFFRYVDRVLWCLQTTENQQDVDRCNEFIEASSSVATNIADWVELYKEGLSMSQLPHTSIDVHWNVKKSLLISIRHILKLIHASKELQTEALDEIVTALTKTVCSATRPELLREAYDRYSEVVSLFKDRKSGETGQSSILTLYDSQFSIAVRNALKCINLSFSFLHSYLHFLVLENKNLTMAVGIYSDGLTNSSKTTESLTLSAELIDFTIGDYENEPLISKLCDSFAPSFASVINRAITVFSGSEWKDVSEFRTDYLNCYSSIIKALIWIQSRSSHTYITIKRLIEFLTTDLKRTQELWRINAELMGIVSCFDYMHDFDDSERLSSLCAVPQTHQMTHDFIECFRRTLKRGDPIIGPFFDYINGVEHASSKAYASVIYNCTDEFLSTHYSFIFDKIYLDANICSLLFLRTKGMSEATKYFSEQICDPSKSTHDMSTSVRLDLTKRLIFSTQNNSAKDTIVSYVLSQFEDGGYEVVGTLLSSPETQSFGLSILEHFPRDSSNYEKVDQFKLEEFLSFLSLAVRFSDSTSMDDFVLYSIRVASANAVNVKPSINEPSISILSTVRQTAEPLLRSVLQGKCQSLVEFLERKEEQSQPITLTLKTFGTGRSRRQAQDEGEWQSLDSSDSDF